MSYERRIMNVPIDREGCGYRPLTVAGKAYGIGHRDARHAAAEIAAEADARLEVAQRMADALRAVDTYPSTIAAWQEARAALAEWEKQQ